MLSISKLSDLLIVQHNLLKVSNTFNVRMLNGNSIIIAMTNICRVLENGEKYFLTLKMPIATISCLK